MEVWVSSYPTAEYLINTQVNAQSDCEMLQGKQNRPLQVA